MKKILVSLDGLLDTRLGLISQLNPTVAERFLLPESDEYFKRINDDVVYNALGITKTMWFQYYTKRDVSTLMASVVTHIPQVINTIIKMYHDSNEHALSDLDVVLYVNTYPYELINEELCLLEDILLDAMPLLKEIKFTPYTFKSLTPKFIKSNFDYVIMYNYDLWTQIHVTELKKILMPKVHFFIPRLFQREPTQDEFAGSPEFEKLWKLDPFKVMECILAPKMGLTYIAASDFATSLRPPITPDHPVQDLDWLIDQSGSYTPGTFQYDPQYPIRPAPAS